MFQGQALAADSSDTAAARLRAQFERRPTDLRHVEREQQVGGDSVTSDVNKHLIAYQCLLLSLCTCTCIITAITALRI